MTPKELYQWAQRRNIEDAQIRICDGMAVSMYPEMTEVRAGRYEVVIDVSTVEIIEYDDVERWNQITESVD